MANGQGEYRIKLVAEADLKDAKALQREIQATTVKVQELEQATKKATKAQLDARTAPRQLGGSGLATSPTGQNAAEIIARRNKAESELFYNRVGGVIEHGEGGDGRALLKGNQFASGTPPPIPQVPANLSNQVGGLAAKYFTLYQAWKLVKEGFKDSIEAFAEQEQAGKRLDTALIQNGTYTAAYSGHVKNLAEEMRKAAGGSTGEWLNVMAKLSQFGADSSNIGASANAVKNLVGVYGSVEQASMAIQKALEGNFTILRRHGIYINENATQAQKLAQAFNEIERIGGGQLEARMQGLSGAWKQMSSNAKNLGVNLGGVYSEAFHLEDIIRGLSLVFETWADITRKAEKEEGEFTKATAHQTHSMQEQRDIAKELSIEMERLKQSYELAKVAVSGMNAALDSMATAESQTLQKRLERDLKQVEVMVQRRVITEQEGMIRKEKLEEQFAARAELQREADIRKEADRKDAELQQSIATERDLQARIERVKSEAVTREKKEASEQIAAKAKEDLQKETLNNKNIKERLESLNGPAGLMLNANGYGIREAKIAEEEANLKDSDEMMRRMEKLVAKTDHLKGTTSEQYTKDKEKIADLEKMKLTQEFATQRAQYEAYNARRVSDANTTQSRAGFNLENQTRRMELGNDLFQSRGGAPSVHASPQELEREHVEQRRHVQQLIADAIANHETPETIRQLQGYFYSLGGTPADYRQTLNRVIPPARPRPSTRLQGPSPISGSSTFGPPAPINISGVEGSGTPAASGGLNVRLGNAPHIPNGAPSVSGDFGSAPASGGLSVRLGGAASQQSSTTVQITLPSDSAEQVGNLFSEMRNLMARKDAAYNKGLKDTVNDLNRQIEALQSRISNRPPQ